MKKIDRRIIVVAAFIFIVGLSYGIMRFLISQKEEPPRRMSSDIKRYVETEKVVYSTIVSTVEASGRLNSLAEVDIVAEASGKILQGNIALKKGAEFKKGELLFVVYSDEAKLSLQARKSQFLNSLANILPDIRIDFEEYEKDFTSFFNAVEIDRDLPSLPSSIDDKLKVYLASRNILSEYYGIRKDELQLSRYSVYAPFNGTYTDVFLEAGAYTNSGGRVAHAIQVDELELEVPVKKDDALWIRIGDAVSVMRPGDPVEWKGRVVRKGIFLDDDTQSQSLFIRLLNDKNHTLLNGEYLTARFPGHPVQQAMEIPRKAVFNEDEVFIVVDGRLERRNIDVLKKNENTLIFRGLEEGSLLVAQALVNVQEGVSVTTEKEAKPAAGRIDSSAPGMKQDKKDPAGDATADKSKGGDKSRMQ